MQRKEALLILCERIAERVEEIRRMIEHPTTSGDLSDDSVLAGTDPEKTDRYIIQMALGEMRFFIDSEFRDPYWEMYQEPPME